MGRSVCGIQINLHLHLGDVSVPTCDDSEEKELTLRN